MPSLWRPVVEDPATLQLFLTTYTSCQPPLSSQALECLVSSPVSQLQRGRILPASGLTAPPSSPTWVQICCLLGHSPYFRPGVPAEPTDAGAATCKQPS